MQNCLKLLVFLNLIFGLVATATAQTLSPQAAELEDLPPALKESLTLYLLEGTNQAIINLKNYWLPTRESDDFSREIRERIRDLDRYFREPEKVELIFERRLSDSLRSYYIMIGYQEGVLFARFDVYSVNEKAWIIDYAVNSRMNAVVPDYIDTAR